jgi:hypothetical protein
VGMAQLTIKVIAAPPTSRFAAFVRTHPSPKLGEGEIDLTSPE